MWRRFGRFGASVLLWGALGFLLLPATPGEAGAADCFNCSKTESTKQCEGYDQCKGTRKRCQRLGCKILGTASCSTAANTKICS